MNPVVPRVTGRARLIGLAVAVALGALVGGATLLHGGDGNPTADALAAPQGAIAMPRLPRAPRPAFVPRRPVLLDRWHVDVHWASVTRPVAVRRTPDASSSIVDRLSATTPEDTANLVLVRAERLWHGTLWTRVAFPALPRQGTGWVPRAALGAYVFVRTRLVVDRQRLVALLYRDGRLVFRAPVGIGRAEWPTPRGNFYIREELTRFRSPFYGPVAFGTSARSAVLTDWPGGGFIGIHGTNQPELLPGRVSHGCIRLRNSDIVRLARLMPVGTPLTIR
jgi:hypothetical protein